MCHRREERDKRTVRTIDESFSKILQALSTMRLSIPGSRRKARVTSRNSRTILTVGLAMTFLLLALVPACHGASASMADDKEGRSLLPFSPSALKKRLGGALRPTGRSYFDAEDILLFMLGLGLASMLGLATFMAPLHVHPRHGTHARHGAGQCGTGDRRRHARAATTTAQLFLDGRHVRRRVAARDRGSARAVQETALKTGLNSLLSSA
ncbi:hypothetical protein MRX96_010833 [Rhipicephalus microplus]